MLAYAPDYERLPLIGKVDAFEYALQNTEGNDLAKVYKSTAANIDTIWLVLICSSNLNLWSSLLLGTLVKKQNFWSLACSTDKLYKKPGSYEYGMK